MSNDNLTIATQNLVVAYGQQVQSSKYLAGQYTSSSFSGPAPSANVGLSLYKGAGRLVRVCVLVTDGTLIDFFDSAVPSITPPLDWLFSLEPTATPGAYEIGVEFSSGLVAIVRGNSTINVTYSIG
jgi:hypothetical protein